MKVNNPMEIINMIKSGQNPQQVLMNILEGDMKGTPMGSNLLELAKNNRTDAITNIVKNICDERGIDFDKEFTAFKQMLGVK